MSVTVMRYARPNAEIRAMVSRLLSRPELEALAGVNVRRPARDVLEDALRLLERTAYAPYVAEVLRVEVSFTVAERAVERSFVDAARRVASLLPESAAALIEEMVRRLDLDNLKAILRGIVRQEPPAAVRELLIPLGPLSSLPLEELLRAESVPAVTDLLAGTDYGRVLRNALPRFTREGSLFPVETALDLDYYRRLWSRAMALPGRDRAVASRLLGIRYDLLNVEWVVRFRLIYHLSPEELFNYTLPNGLRLSSTDIRRAASADDLVALAGALPSPYRELLAAAARLPDPLDQASAALHRYLVDVAVGALAGYPFHVGIAIAYLWLKEAEVHDLKAIFEGLRFGQPSEQIIAALWRAG